MEEEVENLRLSNAKLENRNDLLVRRLRLHSELRPACCPVAVATGSMTLRTPRSAGPSK